MGRVEATANKILNIVNTQSPVSPVVTRAIEQELHEFAVEIVRAWEQHAQKQSVIRPEKLGEYVREIGES